MNLARGDGEWQRALSVTPLPVEVRRRAALAVADHAKGRGPRRRQADCRGLLEHLGLLDPDLREWEPAA